jgi:hypothetical protein
MLVLAICENPDVDILGGFIENVVFLKVVG